MGGRRKDAIAPRTPRSREWPGVARGSGERGGSRTIGLLGDGARAVEKMEGVLGNGPAVCLHHARREEGWGGDRGQGRPVSFTQGGAGRRARV
eukprot:scaffold323383_cov31-Tisochrysis_lutea.AAC.4